MGPGQRGELLDQPGLADPGLAAQHHRLARAGLPAGLEHAGELAQLRLAADQGPARARARLAGQPARAPHPDRFVQALDRDLAQVVAVHVVQDGALDRLGDQGLAGLGEAVEARGQVHRVAQDRVFPALGAAQAAGHHLATGDAHVDPQFAAELGAQGLHGAVDIESGADRAQRIVAMGDRRPEQRHHRIPHVLVDGAAIVLDGPVGDGEEARHQGMQLLGIERGRKLGEAGDVGEQDGDLAALAGGPGGRLRRWRRGGRRRGGRRGGRGGRRGGRRGRVGGAQGLAAAAAEPGVGLVLEPAARTGDGERRPAAGAEPPVTGIVGPAGLARHRPPSPSSRRRGAQRPAGDAMRSGRPASRA